MALAPGSRLGPYEIVSRIGAGGMGEVFRARDTRLDRTVAVKTLPAELSSNAQLRVRLEREARAISALSHPNICALYDVGEQEGVHFLVMEHLEGETLADRIERGALPLRDALRYGIEIAAALDLAHRQGVVHRDLKPGNIMLTRTGAKLLDFGLARNIENTSISADAPTMQARQPLTAEGTIVGTFQYMSPEQLEGDPADPRADIFAFGAVLYEMITGQRAFSGKTRTSLIAAIVAASPRPMSELQPVTPGPLEHVVARCLEKDRDARWQSAHDVKLELEYIARQLDAPAARHRRSRLPWVVAGLAAIVAIAAALLAWRNAGTSETPARAIRAQVLAPEGKQFVNLADALSISPDGQHITFRVQSDDRLWLRSLASDEAKPLAGTEHAILPIWSPDSRWIAFAAEGKLKKISITGTPPIVLCDADKARLGSWSEDGVILFSATSLSPIYRVSANGGAPQQLTKLAAGETTHRWATFLPDNNHFLYLAATHDAIGSADGSVYVTSLDKPHERKLVLNARSNVLYVRGHLLYARGRQLLAQRFDTSSLTVSGDPISVAPEVQNSVGYFRSSFAASHDGTIVLEPPASADDVVLMIQKPSGETAEIMRPKAMLSDLILSPDDTKVMGGATDPETGMNDLWLFDLVKKSRTRLTATADYTEWAGVWSRDGKRITFLRGKGFSVDYEVVEKPLDGRGPERVLTAFEGNIVFLTDWSPDGRYLLYRASEPGKDVTGDVFALPIDPIGKPIPIAATPAQECCGTFSPDGKWVVFASDSTRRYEMYAIPFPPAGAEPASLGIPGPGYWGAGNQLVIGQPDSIAVAPVRIAGGAVEAGEPRLLFKDPEAMISGNTNGRIRVYTMLRPNAHRDSITLISGWRPPE